jgi:DNA-binding NtrC family response regulator
MRKCDLSKTIPASIPRQEDAPPDRPARILLIGADAKRRRLDPAVAATGSRVQWVKSSAEALAFLNSAGAAHISLVLIEGEAPMQERDALAGIQRRFPHLPILMALPEASGYPASLSPAHPARTTKLHSAPDGEGGDAICAQGEFDLGVGWSRQVTPLLKQVAVADAPVLLLGETGAGKEVLARYLHALSPRRAKPFVKVNCAALPSELVESELFGYERGAFTGAVGAKPGRFDLAAGGTILLDEIGDMELRLQAKLLQVLQDHTYDRLGGKTPRQADVRIIAATHCDLEAAVRDRRFRQDLYYRLNVIAVCVPPLRERRDEIVPLCELFLRKHAQEGGPLPGVPDSLKEALIADNWPGNVRELENVIRRLLVLRNPQVIERELKLRRSQEAPTPRETGFRRPSSEEAHPGDLPSGALERLAESKRQSEAATICAALERVRWNRRKAAALLQISYKTLLYRMRKFGLTDQANEPETCSASGGEAGRHATPCQGAAATSSSAGERRPKVGNNASR